MEDGRERLRANAYPGRGIITGLDETGRLLLQLYWITGRSAGSRNRRLVVKGGDVFAQPFDEAGRTNDPNIYYRTIATTGDRHVVTNGNHTDVITSALAAGDNFKAAVRTTSYETDAPNFTPRIAGLADLSVSPASVTLARAFRGAAGETLHHVFRYDDLPAGAGYCIHTYASDGDPVPAFTGAPFSLRLPGTPADVAAGVWDLLPPERRVALAVKAIDVASKRVVLLDVLNSLA